MNRPVGVSIVVVLIVLSAVFDLIVGTWLMIAAFGSAPDLTDHLGNAIEVSGFYLFINGALSVILGLMYFWLTKMTLIGSATARTIITMLAAINLFFGLFRLPFGWGIILISLLIIIMVNTKSAKAYFTQAA
jgi:hypothetical protein